MVLVLIHLPSLSLQYSTTLESGWVNSSHACCPIKVMPEADDCLGGASFSFITEVVFLYAIPRLCDTGSRWRLTAVQLLLRELIDLRSAASNHGVVRAFCDGGVSAVTHDRNESCHGNQAHCAYRNKRRRDARCLVDGRGATGDDAELGVDLVEIL